MDELEAVDVGQRTKRIVEMVSDEILRMNPEADGEKLAIKVLEKGVGLKIKNAKEGTDALFFMSRKQAQNLARIVGAAGNDGGQEGMSGCAASGSGHGHGALWPDGGQRRVVEL